MRNRDVQKERDEDAIHLAHHYITGESSKVIWRGGDLLQIKICSAFLFFRMAMVCVILEDWERSRRGMYM